MIKDELQKKLEGLMPSITEVLQGNHKILVTHAHDGALEFTKDGILMKISDSVKEQIQTFINLTELYSGK